jgi:hypothetical protein
MGDIWPLGEKYLQIFKLKNFIFEELFCYCISKKKKTTKFLCHVAIDSQQYRRMLTFFYFHMVPL